MMVVASVCAERLTNLNREHINEMAQFQTLVFYISCILACSAQRISNMVGQRCHSKAIQSYYNTKRTAHEVKCLTPQKPQNREDAHSIMYHCMRCIEKKTKPTPSRRAGGHQKGIILLQFIFLLAVSTSNRACTEERC